MYHHTTVPANFSFSKYDTHIEIHFHYTKEIFTVSIIISEEQSAMKRVTLANDHSVVM